MHDARFSICALDVTMSIAVILAISAVEALVDSGDGGYGKICSNFNGIECRMLDFMADVCIVSANRIGTVATLRTFRMSASKSPVTSKPPRASIWSVAVNVSTVVLHLPLRLRSPLQIHQFSTFRQRKRLMLRRR
jgi:hypothetical protein